MPGGQTVWRRVLVLGGARSGKSAFAQAYAAGLGAPVIYLATAQAGDAEMAARIARHRGARPADWETVEEPLWPSRSLDAKPTSATVLLEDLTLLLSNHVLNGDEESSGAEQAEAAVVEEVARLACRSGHLVLVSNEVGLGIVPEHPLGRVFRDAQGRVNQAVAALMDEAYLLVAGIPLALKTPGRAEPGENAAFDPQSLTLGAKFLLVE